MASYSKAMGIARSVRDILRFSVRTSRATQYIALVACATILTMLLPTTPAWALLNPLLISRQVDFSDISPFTKWTPLMPRYEAQRAEMKGRCVGKACMNQQWETLLRRLANKPLPEKIEAVNRFFNAIAYVSDEDNFGINDYWQTPYEMMANGGDCEDYAIAKYISLKRLGVPETAMRIVVVKDMNLDGSVHAMLEVKFENKAYILDNQAKTVLPLARVFHYEPIFAINESKWWSYK